MNAQKANNTIAKVRQLQRKLYLAAKGNSKRKFHALYDKVVRQDILAEAWKRVKANGGAGGIDGISLQDIEDYGVQRLLDEIRENLQKGAYHPQPVRRVFIPKPDGRMRPLGIPVVKDRIVQTAVKIVIEPIFEADFKDCSYGFRPKRNAHQALEDTSKACSNKGWWVVDADIRGYFDTIPHDKLMKLVEMRVNDRRILKLIRLWLKAGVMTGDICEKSEIGSPQGGVISPLLANIYLNYLDTVWEKHGKHLGRLIRYADDFVIISKSRREAQEALNLVKMVMKRLELELHPEKTKLVQMWGGQEGFDFLGMHHRFIGEVTSKAQRYYKLNQFPSQKAMRNMRAAVRQVLASRSTLLLDMQALIDKLNPKLRGWKNYYGVKTAEPWLIKIDWYIRERFTMWYNKKRACKRHRTGLKKVETLMEDKGLIKLVSRTNVEGEECRKAG